MKQAKRKAKKVRSAIEMENPNEEFATAKTINKAEIKQNVAEGKYDHSLHFTLLISH